MSRCTRKPRRAPGAGNGGRRGRLLLLAGAAALLALAGCLSPPAPPDGDALFRRNWWNYYERGARQMRQGRIAEAADDFRRSLGLLPGARFGNDRDRWRARTYGLHFVEGYFPHRELGICLFEQQDVDGAILHLERSLRQAPSGRAKHYLNLARARQLDGRTVNTPQIRFDGGEVSDAPLKDRYLPLSGVAAGAGRIRHLSIGGEAAFIELAETEHPFSRRIRLVEGTNWIAVTAEDLLGRRVTRRWMRVADWQPPAVVIRRVVEQAGGWRVEGVCRDPFGVAAVLLDGRTLYRDTDAQPATEVPLALDLPAAGATLRVIDTAGNELLFPLAGAQVARGESGASAGLSDVNPCRPFDPWLGGFAPFLAQTQAGCREKAFASLAPPAAAPNAAPRADEPDTLRPSLVLRGGGPLLRVYAEACFIDGFAADGGGLARVTVNGENLLGTDDRGALRAYFARRLPLDLGTNRFEIAATDLSGNRSVHPLTVIRFLPDHLDARHRLTVGVPPLTPAEAGPAGVHVKRRMEAELTREPVRFRLLERDEGWDYVLREQGLSLSDLADPAAALSIGKLLPAELLLMGTVFIEARGVTIFLRAVDTENGVVVFTSDVYSPDSNAGLDEAVAGLVLKLGQGFPLVGGVVRQRQGSRVVLNIGRADGTAERSRFLVIDAAGAADTDPGRLCLADGRPVQLQIERLRHNTSTARIIPSTAERLVKEGHHVYTR